MRTVASRARIGLDRCAHALWWSLFKARGLLSPRAESTPAAGGQRILVVAPHPDDEALGCAGAMAQHLAARDRVCVAVVTDGRRSRALGLPSDAMARARRAEAAGAAALLGVSELRWLGLEEGAWSRARLEKTLSILVDELRPDLVYAPSALDYHAEHRRVAAALARVVPDATPVRVYTLHVPLGALANVRVDVSAQMRLIERLFDTYRTQSASLRRGLRLRRYAAASSRCGTGAEEFWELPGEAYRRAHVSGAAPGAVRGMRYTSFGDPLSYLIGRRARIELRERSGAESEPLGSHETSRYGV